MAIDRRSFIVASASGGGILALGGGLAMSRGSDTASDGTVPRNEAFPKLPIGMNLAGIADWEPGFPFRNLFLGARPWVTRNASLQGLHDTKTQSAFQYDQDGYPLQVPINVAGFTEPQILFTYVPNCREPGDYVLLYDGEGEIGGLFGLVRILSQKKGRVKLRMEQGGTDQAIAILKSKLGNHVRNIRLVAENDESVDLSKSPFLPEFVEFCRPFHCLRFMDWGGINNSIEEEWASRKRPTFYTQVSGRGDPDARYSPAPTAFQRMYSGGVAIETMIQLCNELKIDPWFCIPHRATDDYIAQFARLVKERLDPSLKVYVEYSNELWNWSFLQAGWMLQSPLAGAMVEAKGGKAWKDGDRSKGEGHPERIGALFRRAFAIWEREWSGADQKRLVRVCAVQAAWVDASKRTVKWCVDNGGADVVSPAAYFGADDETYDRWAVAGANLTADQVIADVRNGRDLAREGNSAAKIVGYAKSLGLGYVAYEGGQHIQPKGQAVLPYNPALAAAQYHPAMYDAYVDLLRLQRDMGCALLCHFSSVGRQGTRWGSWGAKGTYTEADIASPKFQALKQANTTKAVQGGGS